MIETFLEIYRSFPPTLQKWAKIFVFFVIAWILAWVLGKVVRRLIRLGGIAARRRPERMNTVLGLAQGMVNVLVFTAALMVSLGQFIDTTTLIWMVGLFGAGFGLSARPLISDIMAGTGFIFEDTFAVGEKVELLGIEGVIEAIRLRTTWLRSPTGELYVIPNGDIRIVRNFSRGRFSTANVIFKVPSNELNRVLPMLEQLGVDALHSLPNLIEPWQIISTTGVIGAYTELSLLAKARFGKAAEMRPRMLAMLHEALAEAGIELQE